MLRSRYCRAAVALYGQGAAGGEGEEADDDDGAADHGQGARPPHRDFGDQPDDLFAEMDRCMRGCRRSRGRRRWCGPPRSARTCPAGGGPGGPSGDTTPVVMPSAGAHPDTDRGHHHVDHEQRHKRVHHRLIDRIAHGFGTATGDGQPAIAGHQSGDQPNRAALTQEMMTSGTPVNKVMPAANAPPD